jgi:glycosyltransferase involved in cell wall biosynthesis
MRLGVVPSLEASGGGVYQYSLAVLDVLSGRSAGDSQCPVVFVSFARDPAVASLREKGWEVRLLDGTRSGRLRSLLRRKAAARLGMGAIVERLSVRSYQARIAAAKGRLQFRPDLGSYFRRCGVDLMLYPAPNVISFESGVPYVTAVHDLQHRLQPQFPEVSANGEWDAREYLFRNGIERATTVLADSEVGREDILSLYRIDEDRVSVLPFPPPRPYSVDAGDLERVKRRYDLPDLYGFYPAQFWPHKNHELIVHAVAAAKREGIEICIAFAGSHGDLTRRRRQAELLRLVDRLDLRREVRFLGYVPDGDMPPLYAGARALVMPTFFGPTNIPVIEAWQYRCAVISSNIRGVREQVGDAGLLVDPTSVEELTNALVTLWTDDAAWAGLLDKGALRVAAYTFQDFADRLRSILSMTETRLTGPAGPEHTR